MTLRICNFAGHQIERWRLSIPCSPDFIIGGDFPEMKFNSTVAASSSCILRSITEMLDDALRLMS